jgi:hypothetical protein
VLTCAEFEYFVAFFAKSGAKIDWVDGFANLCVKKFLKPDYYQEQLMVVVYFWLPKNFNHHNND